MSKILKNGKTCNKHEGKHIYPLELEAFSDARDIEFTESCRAIGYRPSRVAIHPLRGKDTELTVEVAERLIRSYLSVFGREAITVCTMSPFDGDSQVSDHTALGKAAVKLYRRRKIKELLLFVEPYCLEGFRDNNPRAKLIETRPTEDERNRLVKAVSAYQLWQPDQGRYCIGYHSVGKAFDEFLADPVSYHHTLKDVR